MTKAQTAQLLTVMAALDRRTIGESDVEAWHLIIGDLDIDDCMTAVREHYTESRDWLMPADVYRRATLTARRREGLARIAARDARIAAENPGVIVQRDMPAIEAKRVPEDEAVRADRRRMLQAAAHAKRQRVEADTTARNAERERLEQARAELDAVRESAAIHGGGGS